MPIDQEVLTAFNEIYSGKFEEPEVQDALELLHKYYDPSTPSHEIKFSKTTNALRITPLFTDKREFLAKIKPVIDKVHAHLRSLGYEDDIYTIQEHRLVGGSAQAPYDQDPYVPLGILRGNISIEQANRARALERRHQALGIFFRESPFLVDISLEPLNEKGMTVRDPIRVDSLLRPMQTSYAKDFPYQRFQ